MKIFLKITLPLIVIGFLQASNEGPTIYIFTLAGPSVDLQMTQRYQPPSTPCKPPKKKNPTTPGAAAATVGRLQPRKLQF